MWFWASSCHLWNWFHDRICCYKMVPSSRAVVELFRLHCGHWCMVSRLHFHGIDGSEAFVSWQRSCASATFAYGGDSFCIFCTVIFLISYHQILGVLCLVELHDHSIFYVIPWIKRHGNFYFIFLISIFHHGDLGFSSCSLQNKNMYKI